VSLDRKGDRVLDRADCWQRAELWPRRVIVMTLDRVGTMAGPDLVTFGMVRSAAGPRQLFGAGGIRDEHDLRAAEGAGATGWLVASALHDRRIPPVRSKGSGQ